METEAKKPEFKLEVMERWAELQRARIRADMRFASFRAIPDPDGWNDAGGGPDSPREISREAMDMVMRQTVATYDLAGDLNLWWHIRGCTCNPRGNEGFHVALSSICPQLQVSEAVSAALRQVLGLDKDDWHYPADGIEFWNAKRVELIEARQKAFAEAEAAEDEFVAQHPGVECSDWEDFRKAKALA